MSAPRVGSSVLFSAVLLGLVVQARAQTVISAAAGLVHYSEGRVFLGEAPLVFDPTHFVHLREGQRLRAARGRVELMLIPDVLVRLDSGAEIEMVNARITDARVRLLSGSCTVEVRHKFVNGTAEALLGEAIVRFDKNGLYRLHNPAEDSPSVQVFRGRAMVTAEGFHSKLKANRTMHLPGNVEQPQIDKLDRLEFALLDEWTRVGDTGRRIGTLGQGAQADEAVLSTKLECEARGACRVPGLDCVLPPAVVRRTLSTNGPRFSRIHQAR